MKKFLSALLALTFVFSMAGMTVSAAVERADRVNIYSSIRRIRVRRTIQLDFRVYPENLDYDDYQWSSDNYDIASVDEYGEVEGMSPGEAIITVRLFKKDASNNNKRVRVGSGSTTITVTGVAASSETEKPKASTTKSSTSSGTFSGRKISTADITSAVKKAVVKGKTTSVRFKDASSVSAASLQSAAASMKNGGGVVLLNFDTMENAKTADVRLTINPADAANLKGDIKLGAYTNEDKVGDLKKFFQEKFKNKMVVVKCGQSGSYGMSVNFSVRMGSTTIREKNIKVYTYNRSTGKYSELENANIWLDSNKFVHFTAATGGYFIISDGTLTRR